MLPLSRGRKAESPAAPECSFRSPSASYRRRTVAAVETFCRSFSAAAWFLWSIAVAAVAVAGFW